MNRVEIKSGEGEGEGTKIPHTLFGVNTQVWGTQRQLWVDDIGALAPSVVDALRGLAGGAIRYPGGLMANNFWWQRAVGEPRLPQSLDTFAISTIVEFGVEEWLALCSSIGSTPVYVLNLRGWDEVRTDVELPIEDVASSARDLAKHLKGRVWFYQLGNELDRSEYEWSHEKYIQRSRAVIDAILSVDPNARFIAFLRDFNWTYKTRSGVSRRRDFIQDVLRALPEVSDFSVQFYYDDKGMESTPSKNLGVRLDWVKAALNDARQVRDSAQVWVTEHARGLGAYLGTPQLRERAWESASLQGAISTADCLIGLMQIEAKGACLFASNGGNWQLFDATHQYNDLRPRPTYWAMRVLYQMAGKQKSPVSVTAENVSGYGYDIRAVAYADRNKVGLCVVNRPNTSTPVIISCTQLANQTVQMRHTYIAGKASGNPDDINAELEIQLEPRADIAFFSADGTTPIVLPPSSVSHFEFAPLPYGGEVDVQGGMIRVLADGKELSAGLSYSESRQVAETAIRSGDYQVVIIRTDDELLWR